MAKQFKSWWDYEQFSSSVKRSARFVHDKTVLTFLDTLLQTSTNRHRHISAGKYIWRAQLGNAVEERNQDEAVWDEPVPYSQERMKPLPYSAHEGRVNPRGIPCLYAATDKITAMSEVRPWLGSTVSIGQLQLKRDLTLVDFSVGHDSKFNCYFEEPPPAVREQAIWAQVDRAFSEPANTDPGTAEYVPTQIISEFFKKKNFDGVVYKSKLGPGFNIALFDPAVADLVNCALCRVESVSVNFSDLENGYHIKPKRTDM